MASVINQIKLGTTEYAIAASAYAECTTAGSSAAKVATICTDSDTTNTAFTLVKGVSVQVKFSSINSAANPTLNVNNTGAKPIYYNGETLSAIDCYLKTNGIYTFVYDSDRWNLVGDHVNTDINNLTTERVLISSTSGGITTSAINSTELYYLKDANANIQAQLDGKAASSHGTHVTYATAAGKANGTAAVGTSSKVAREDHVHPTDTSRAPTSHASSSSTYGLGTTANYGHVKISNGDVDTVASASGLAAGMDHTHSKYVAKDTTGGIQVTQVDTSSINSQGYLSIHAADGSINLTATDSADDDTARVQLKSSLLELSKVEPVNDEDSSHIMLYDDQLDISVRGQANTTEDYETEITSGISISSHQVTIGDINAVDNDPEYDQMEVNIDADSVQLNTTRATVKNAKIITADDFEYDSSTGYLVINTAWKE